MSREVQAGPSERITCGWHVNVGGVEEREILGERTAGDGDKQEVHSG